MNDDELKRKLLELLAEIAPELEPSEVSASESLRDQLDLDSMDFLNFMIAVHKAFGVEIPEAEYRNLQTLEGCVAWLKAAGATL